MRIRFANSRSSGFALLRKQSTGLFSLHRVQVSDPQATKNGAPKDSVLLMVVGGGLEPSARGFSVPCSTN